MPRKIGASRRGGARASGEGVSDGAAAGGDAGDHPDPVAGCVLLSEALGSCDVDIVFGLQRQLAKAVQRGGKISEDDLNFLIAVVKDIKPRDQLESMLVAQMAVIHEAIMTFARRLGNVEDIAQQDSAERAFNKLARTFAVITHRHF
jgi:hypothetical protein